MVGTTDDSSPASNTRSQVEESTNKIIAAKMMDVEPMINLNISSPLTPNTSAVVDDLFSANEETCMASIIALKTNLIGSNRQKQAMIERGVVPRLIELLGDQSFSPSLRISVAYALGSIAKGSDVQLRILLENGVVPALLRGLATGSDPKQVEACLSCLKTVFHSPEAPHEVIYSEPSIVPHLINLMLVSNSNKVSVSSIFAQACKNRDHQDYLSNHGLIPGLNILLCSPLANVQLPALKCLAILVWSNENVARIMKDASLADGTTLLGAIENLMNRNRKLEIQLEAARCMAYLFRCGVLDETDKRIIYKAMPCFVRMTKKEEHVETRILAADTLAYLIEGSAELQRTAAISNGLIQSMASYLTWEPTKNNNRKGMDDNSNNLANLHTTREMKRAAFRVFGSLAANDEDIRKRVIETEKLLPDVVAALDEPEPKLQMAAIGCLHSLSRSVQLLRTTFQDHPVWKPLMKILTSAPSTQSSGQAVQPLIVASSALCNLLLQFSPSKDPIMDAGGIGAFCQLTHKYDSSLRLNGVWGLMNMAFQAEQNTKVQIIKSLEPDQIFRLLSDPDESVVTKTLGLLRNILSNKAHIDFIMSLQDYGKQIMQAVVLTLESDKTPEVKEHALCLLGHIADGTNSRDFIMSNEDVLKKVTNYMTHHNIKLRVAAVYIVENLAWGGDVGASERQGRLREIGVYKILQQLDNPSTDEALHARVKLALDQFT